MDYIFPIWIVLISLPFVLLLNGIKKKHFKAPIDVDGITSFQMAFLLWAAVGVIKLVSYVAWPSAPNSDPDSSIEKNSIFICICVLFSTLNSFYFLKAVSSIEVKKDYFCKKFVKGISDTSNLFLYVLVIIVTVITISLTILFYKEPASVMNIWIPDTFFSILALSVLGGVLSLAFNERKIYLASWVAGGVILFIFLSVLLEIYPVNVIAAFFNVKKEFVSAAKILVGISYKTVLCLLILVLVYSKKLLETEPSETDQANLNNNSDNGTSMMELQNQNAELKNELLDERLNREKAESGYHELKEKADGLLSEVTLLKEINTSNKELTNKQTEQVNQLIKELEWYKDDCSFAQMQNSNPSLPYIQFHIDEENEQYLIRVRESREHPWNEISFKGNIELFRRIFKLAIHKKYGKTEEEQFMQYYEPSSKETEEESKKKDYKLFTPKQKSDILSKVIKDKCPKFEDTFLKISNKRIAFCVPPENISLPTLVASDPESIFEKYPEFYHVLTLKRDSKK